MVKNKKGGKKCKKTKALREDATLNYKTEGQEYGHVLKLLGNCRLEAYCFDGKKRICTIRGKMRKRIFINKDDIIIVSLREFQDEKGDVIDKYSETQKRMLIENGTIPDIDFNSFSITDQFKKYDSGNQETIVETNENDATSYWSNEEKINEIDLDDI
tara:strand:- start:235 stop:708 length:474 start_codon:yes stop_codon:yes gene_type:complete